MDESVGVVGSDALEALDDVEELVFDMGLLAGSGSTILGRRLASRPGLGSMFSFPVSKDAAISLAFTVREAS